MSHLGELALCIGNMDVPIVAVSAKRDEKKKTSNITMVIQVKSREQLRPCLYPAAQAQRHHRGLPRIDLRTHTKEQKRMLTKRRAYLLAEAVCLATALLWALSAFPCTHPLYGGAGADSALFCAMGRGIAQGLTPYVDIIENKGPLFF